MKAAQEQGEVAAKDRWENAAIDDIHSPTRAEIGLTRDAVQKGKRLAKVGEPAICAEVGRATNKGCRLSLGERQQAWS